MRTPICILTANDKPLNALITARIISVKVTDNRADEADQLEISLDDSDGALDFPKRGVKINCKFGWRGHSMHDKGDFIVDECGWGGPADTLTIRASAANFKSNIKTEKSKSFHQKKLGEIAKSIASANNLKLNINNELAKINIQHIDQTNESDLNFLRRLAQQNGAEMTVKKGQLLIFKAGSGLTASGKKLPSITITKNDGDQYDYSEEDRDSDYTGVSARYTDHGKATKKRVTSGNPEVKGGGDDANTKTKVLKGTFASKDEAQRAADAEMSKKQRQKAKFTFNTAYGIPEVSTETPVTLLGFKKQIDQLKWIVSKATHDYSSSGFKTDLELEASV
ncbi:MULTISPECIES: contractile injection system protein, VgrG/Pvc8 family [unclassified Acinetobacter]|uniref:contractile injection system protein, VgrG/Pvc8 family n=1 Tax=unclassified Acinetobacter TaxID=196816 RepID=UPI0022AC03DE|nr:MULTISPECIES: contractile injection system protein, VgrG/Pvc8 family [unclassified Acinetobacter]WAU72964.1 contractile injection system protein, VgrG/Pvc8 family [Acinetobacter sp. TR11]WAU76058.1 contractile injection system protein, VgrG/Pvc8 family [Acinetobacter sp. TR3]